MDLLDIYESQSPSTSDEDEDMQAIEEDEEQQQHESPPWSRLPPHVVENVYSYLNRRDQHSMSLVCRDWRREYSSPGLWRRFRLCLPCLDRDAELFDASLARGHGAKFRHLDVVFGGGMRSRYLGATSRLLKSFLGAVASRSQLLSISFEGMDSYLMRLDDAASEEARRAVVDCLRSQSELQRVRFSNSQFRQSAAAEILGVVLANNFATLRCLLLTGFVDDDTDDESDDWTVDGFLNFLTALMNLRVWKIDYCRIFEDMVLSFYEYRNSVDLRERKGHLEEIELFCNGYNTDDYLRIHPGVWIYFRKIFPHLRISMTFQSWSEPRNLDFFIVPHMPLRALDFQWEDPFRDGSISEIGTLLGCITASGINKSLEVLKIVWRRKSLNLVPDLIGFTNVCPELRILQLYVQHPVEALDVVFNSWLENRPRSLELVQITVAFVESEEGDALYASMDDFYAPLLQSLDLNLILLVN